MSNPLEVQEGGSHYKDMVIQPVEFIHANNLGFCEATAIKYLCRWRKKGGIQDLKKAIHFIQVLIELETRPTPPKVVEITALKVVMGPYCDCGELAKFRLEGTPTVSDPLGVVPRYYCSWCSEKEPVSLVAQMTAMDKL